MNVSLTPKLEAFVRRKVAEGLYGNASEVVREALRRQIEAENATVPAVASLAALVARLRTLESRLRARGVMAMHVVGSVARGDAGPGSDVDLLIDPDPDARFHLLDLAAVQHACAEALGRPTDVLTRGALDAEVLAAMERDAVRVF
jgi:putative addiction module CopG family antidote